MDIIRLAEGKSLSVSEKVLNFLGHSCSFPAFLAQLRQELDGFGVDLAKACLESLDQELRDSMTRKQEWTVVRNNDRKEILTPFGLFSYTRSYYRHKESKEYCYLVDEKAGITPHSRVCSELKAELAAACGEMSYENATSQLSRYNPTLKVSKQTAGKSVIVFQPKPLTELREKRRVNKLYLEADEDHLKVGRRRAQACLIYVHEGIGKYPRRHLINARYFATVQKKPEEFWLEVLDYLDTYYDLDSVQELYISGDGASWIRNGQEYIPNSIFILENFTCQRPS